MNWSELNAVLCWAYHREVKAGWKQRAETRDGIPAWFVRHGELSLSIGKRRHHATTGQWMLPESGQGWVWTDKPSDIISYRIRVRWPTGQDLLECSQTFVLGGHEIRELNRSSKNLLRLIDASKCWQQESWSPPDAVEHFHFQSALSGFTSACIAARLQRGERPTAFCKADLRLQRTLRILNQWPLELPFSRKELSAEVGIGVQQLTKDFVSYVGITPRAFFERRKLEWACTRLSDNDAPIKVIAIEVGLPCLPQFSQWFSKRVGKSPRSFRNEAVRQHASGKNLL